MTAAADLERLLALLRSTETRDDAVAVVDAKVRPAVAAMAPAKVRAVLAEAVFVIDRLEREHAALEALNADIPNRVYVAKRGTQLATTRENAQRSRSKGTQRSPLLEAHALQLANAGDKNGKAYTSRMQAAKAITKRVHEYAEAQKLELRPSPRTIYDWLGDAGYRRRRRK